MSFRFITSALLMALMPSTASAIDYVGKFKGVVTGGGITRTEIGVGSTFTSLVGTPVTFGSFYYTERPTVDDFGLPAITRTLTICDIFCSFGSDIATNSYLSFNTDGNQFSGYAFDWTWGGAQNSWSEGGFGFNKATGQGGGSTFIHYYFDEEWSYSWTITSGSVYAVVPEPSTWALLLSGFGLIGWQIRQRDRRRSFLTAWLHAAG